MELTKKINKHAFALGFDLIGFNELKVSDFQEEIKDWVNSGKSGSMDWYAKNLDRRLDPRQNLFNQARTAISVGLLYRPPELPEEIINDPSRGIIARYALYNDYHDLLKSKLEKLVEKLKRDLDRDFNYQIYIDTGPVVEREIAEKAKLGFIGKNTTLINTTLGSYLFLGEIICDLNINISNTLRPASRPGGQTQGDILGLNPKFKDYNIEGTCGSCQRCQVACPTKALVKPYVLDARKCISYLTIENKGEIPIELRPLLKNRIYGCDICQEVCPWNKKDIYKSELRAEADQTPLLLELVNLTEQDFKQRFKGLPILRAKRRGFIRNVLVAIGNWGDKAAFEPVLGLLNDKEELVRQHAAWALFMIDKASAQKILKKHIIKEESDIVKNEINLLINSNE